MRVNEVAENKASGERGIFGATPNLEARFIEDHARIEEYAQACKTMDLRVVLTSGSFDLIHIGHAKYLEVAKSYGDVLIVGVDSDTKIKKRKGEDRPVVPEGERVQMLAHLRSVDIITLKQPDEARWELIKRVRPDTLIVTEEAYDDDTLDELSQLCGRIVSLKPQATTSTSAQIRRLQVGWTSQIINPVESILRKHNASEALRREIGKLLLDRKDG